MAIAGKNLACVSCSLSDWIEPTVRRPAGGIAVLVLVCGRLGSCVVRRNCIRLGGLSEPDLWKEAWIEAVKQEKTVSGLLQEALEQEDGSLLIA
jgi:hypothetical protein